MTLYKFDHLILDILFAGDIILHTQMAVEIVGRW